MQVSKKHYRIKIKRLTEHHSTLTQCDTCMPTLGTTAILSIDDEVPKNLIYGKYEIKLAAICERMLL